MMQFKSKPRHCFSKFVIIVYVWGIDNCWCSLEHMVLSLEFASLRNETKKLWIFGKCIITFYWTNDVSYLRSFAQRGY